MHSLIFHFQSNLKLFILIFLLFLISFLKIFNLHEVLGILSSPDLDHHTLKASDHRLKKDRGPLLTFSANAATWSERIGRGIKSLSYWLWHLMSKDHDPSLDWLWSCYSFPAAPILLQKSKVETWLLNFAHICPQKRAWVHLLSWIVAFVRLFGNTWKDAIKESCIFFLGKHAEALARCIQKIVPSAPRLTAFPSLPLHTNMTRLSHVSCCFHIYFWLSFLVTLLTSEKKTAEEIRKCQIWIIAMSIWTRSVSWKPSLTAWPFVTTACIGLEFTKREKSYWITFILHLLAGGCRHARGVFGSCPVSWHYWTTTTLSASMPVLAATLRSKRGIKGQAKIRLWFAGQHWAQVILGT